MTSAQAIFGPNGTLLGTSLCQHGLSHYSPHGLFDENAYEEMSSSSAPLVLLACVWPTDLNVPELVRPPALRLWLSVAGILLCALQLFGVDRPTRPANALAAALLSLVPILPWIWLF